MAIRTVVSTAANQDGTAQTTTTKVINTLTQELKLKYKLAAASDSTATNIILKAAAARNGSSLALNGKITYSVVGTGFTSYDEMITFYKFISTNAYGLVIQTTDTDNFQDNTITITEQDVTGLKRNVVYDLSEFRTNVTGGYSDKIVLEESDFNQIFWPGMEITLATIKPSSSMSFTWYLRGWNKAQELNAVQSQTLG